MRIDAEPDINRRDRRVMNFDTLGIDHLIRLGEVRNNAIKDPVLEHVHRDSFEVVLFQTGSQNYFVGSDLYTVQSGQMFFTLPNEPHSSSHYYEDKSHFFYFIFALVPQFSQIASLSKSETELAKALLFSLPSRIYPVPRHLFSHMQKMLDLYFSELPFRASLIQSYANELLCSILAALLPRNEKEDRTFVNQTLENMKEYIELNLSRQIKADDLAHQVNLSESRVNQIFRENGLTLHDYILRRKIEMAKEMLYRTDLSITQIALQLDFNTSQHFATTFARYTRQTPSDYRRKRRAHPTPD